MKELSIEEKAKAYDEALKRAIKHHNNDGLTLEQYETIDIIFPELKESKDERDKERTYKIVNDHQITIGTKIRLKTNPNIILSIISNDCHEDEFECSNGSVLSLKQIEKYYDIII